MRIVFHEVCIYMIICRKNDDCLPAEEWPSTSPSPTVLGSQNDRRLQPVQLRLGGGSSGLLVLKSSPEMVL